MRLAAARLDADCHWDAATASSKSSTPGGVLANFRH